MIRVTNGQGFLAPRSFPNYRRLPQRDFRLYGGPSGASLRVRLDLNAGVPYSLDPFDPAVLPPRCPQNRNPRPMARPPTCPSRTRPAASLLWAAALLGAAAPLWVASLCGCASQQTFRVVDDKSGQPLKDLRVERLEGGYSPSSTPFVVLNELSPAEKLDTNESGSVTFQKSGSKFMVNPSHANPGYTDAYVTATWSGATVCYPAEHREFSVARKDGVLEIPLRRRSLDDDPSSADMASADRGGHN